MKIGVIHLSDIHIVGKTEQNSVLKKRNRIVDSLKNRILDFKQIFIVISGDIAFSGKQDEYNIAIDFLNGIKTDLEKYINQSIYLVGVPGNHDCDFSSNQNTRTLILEGLTKSDYSNLDTDVIDQCCSVQKDYFAFESKLFFDNSIRIYSDPLLKIINYKIGDYTIGFNCYNTSWTSKINEVEGSMAFPSDYYLNELSQNDALLKINIIHHPINWQNKSSHRELRKFLNQNGDITLSGHEHQLEINKITDASDNSNLYIESAALQTNNKTKSYFNFIAFDLENNRINVNLFDYIDGSYIKKEVLKDKKIFEIEKKNRIAYALNSNYQNYLESLSAQFLHKRTEQLTLDDLFVNPYLRTTDNDSENISIVNFSEIIGESIGKLIIIGEETSGKTTLCKKIFKHYYHEGLVPILVKGIKITKPTIDYIINVLLKTEFEDQYNQNSISKFDEIDLSKILLIIDNFHTCELAEESRKEFLKTVSQHFKNIVMTSNSILYFNQITDSDGILSDYNSYNILEFSYALRYEIIKKWNALGESELVGNNLLRKNENYDSQVKSFLGKKFLPHYPFVIIAALQAIDHGNTEQGFSYYYKYLIEESLKKHIKKIDDLQFYNFFLSDYCFFLFESKIKTISNDSFEDYFKAYTKRKKVTISFVDAYRQLIDSKTIRSEGDFVSISYNYIYYYYTANYIANNIDDVEKKALVKKLIERLYIDEYAGIILFLTQLSSNPFIIDTLKYHTDEYFTEYSPATLSSDIEGIDFKEIPELVFKDKEDIENRQRQEIAKRDEAEREDLKTEESYLSKDYDLNDDISAITVLNKLIRAVKTFEIFGQVVKKNWGVYDGDKKEIYVKSVFDLSMRVLASYFTYIKENKQEIADYVNYIADKKEIFDKQEIKDLATNIIFHFTYMSTHGIIKRVSNSISHVQLKETFNDLIEKHPTNSHKLIRLAITMDHFGQLPIEEIDNLLSRDKEFKKYYLPRILVQNFVYQYLHMYEVPYDVRNKICTLVGIKIEQQRQIQAGSKQMK